MIIDDKTGILAGIHPLLPAKLKMDEEERIRQGQQYRLVYEKTYASGNKDTSDSSIKAIGNEEAIKYAQEKLQMKDALARWDTDITDAVLIAPNGEELLVPPYSKKLRLLRESEEREQALRKEVQKYIQFIENKSYGVQREDGSFNYDCYYFCCDGKFTEVKFEYDFIAVSCTKSLSHKDEDRGWLSFRNGWSLEDNVARALHSMRGKKEDQMARLRDWMRSKWNETEYSNQQFEEWLEKQKRLYASM